MPDAAGSESRSSALARAMFSRLPRSSMWLSPTFVTTPQWGRTNEHSCAIWPAPRMPISTTTASVSGSAAKSVLGTPSSLFWLPFVATTVCAAASTSRTRFFVVVLPVEPVMPITRPLRCPRHSRAKSVMACAVSGTSMTAAPSSRASASTSEGSGCMTSAHTAPARRAAATKSWPSTRSPGSATYASPGFTSRESQARPVASTRASIGSTANWPPVHAAICFSFKRMLAPLFRWLFPIAREPVEAGADPRRIASEGALELFGGDHAVVEAEHPIAHELVVLVPLARDEHRVAGARERDGARDGAATVGLHFEAARARAHAAHDVLDDGARILGAGVVARHDGAVGREGGFAHDGPLPNTQMVRPGVSAMMDESAFSSASGVWA